MNNPISSSPNEVTQKGEQIYLNELKDELEKEHSGEYVVIEVESKKYFINKDLVIALNQAKSEFPDKLFFIVQIGTFRQPSIQAKSSNNYEWLL